MNQTEVIGNAVPYESISPQQHVAGLSNKLSSSADKVSVDERVDNFNTSAGSDFIASVNALKRDESFYSYDQDLDKLVVKILNSDTKELIKQIPTEESLSLSRKMQEMIGLMFK